MKNIIVLLAFLVPAFSFAVTEPVACTMDAKLCPDGVTYVGRVGPSCAFAACPGETKPVPPICTNLRFDLDVGSTDTSAQGEVSVIQNFLYPQYLKVKPTGAFYGLTRAAVAQFQKDNGIFPARGYIGSLTRAKIKELLCGGTSNTLAINTIDPKIAKVGQTVTLEGPGLNSGGDYILFNGYRIETDGSKAINRVSFPVPESVKQTINCITTPCPQGPVIKITPGTYTVAVVNDKGTTNIVKLVVTDGSVPPPTDKVTISFVEPRKARVGESVIIYGYNLFRPETKILFEGHSLRGTPVYNKRLGDFNSALEFTVPSYLSSCSGFVCIAGLGRKVTPGGYELAVENKYGRDAVKFEVLGDTTGGKPYLTSVSPEQGIVGTEVYVFGQNINTGSEKIYFGGSIVPSTSLSTDRTGKVRFKIPEYITPCGYEDDVACRMIAQLVTPGKYDVVVKNKEGLSNTLSFNVVSVSTNTKPEIISLSPAKDVVGTEVSILGRGINTGSEKVYFGGSLVTILSNSATDQKGVIRFRVPEYITPCGYEDGVMCRMMAQLVTPGKYDVVVKNANGLSNILSFTVTSSTSNPPTITSFSPNTAPVGTQVLITGTGFTMKDDKVYFGASGAVDWVRPTSETTMVFNIPRYSANTGTENLPGKYDVVVKNTNGSSNSLSFNVIAPQQISSLSPAQNRVGTEVTIFGRDITGSEKVYFGGSLVTSVSNPILKEIYFTVPEYISPCGYEDGVACRMIPQLVTPGKYDVVVKNANGLSNILSFTVTSSTSNPPTITSFSPNTAPVGTGVEMTGTGFTPTGNKVYFGGSDSGNYLGVDSADGKTLRFGVPVYSVITGGIYLPGKYDVVVKNANGLSNSLSFNIIPHIDTESLAITNFYITLADSLNTKTTKKLVWTTTGAQYCDASGSWSGAQKTSGEYLLPDYTYIQAPSYTLTCYNEKGVSVSSTVK